MSAALPPDSRMAIGTVRVTASSGLAARQLADGLPLALERALRGQGGSGLADRVAADIVAAAARKAQP